MDAIAERPDGTRVPFLPYPTPLYDAAGALIGAVNMLVDMTEWKRAEGALQHFAAIVESSDDAIISKDLNGIITSWNKGAERIFGYLAEEMIGKSIKILIPADLQREEDTILERIRSRPAHRALRDRAPAQIWRPGRYFADRLAHQECARHDRRRLQDRPRHHRAQTRRSADCHARARGRAPRQERAGDGAGDRSPDAGRYARSPRNRRSRAAFRRSQTCMRCS